MTLNKGAILIVDDDKDVGLAAELLLNLHFSEVHSIRHPGLIAERIKTVSIDVILLDMNFTRKATDGEEGFFWLHQIRQMDPAIVVILITAYGDVEMAVQAIKQGATDFILKPWKNEKLVTTVSAALELARSRREVDFLKDRQKEMKAELAPPTQTMIGGCSAMQGVFEIIAKVAATDASVLITGENGTGKELVARDIHRRSGRAHEMFISMDMGAIPESLFESELFGHEKGAFTGAHERRMGKLVAAAGGTVFLDEIGNLILPLQAKLLRVLEQRRVVPLGANRPRPADFRLICATNRPIYQLAAEGNFREDLLFRINTVEIQLPPLRERQRDIAELAMHFVALYARKYHKQIDAIGDVAMSRLNHYHWPGNVRELRHTIERAMIMCDGPALEADDFRFPDVYKGECDPQTNGQNLAGMERRTIESVLKQHEGNVSRSARALGLTRGALYRRMKKHGL